jgi:multidrug resistance protein MdtO
MTPRSEFVATELPPALSAGRSTLLADLREFRDFLVEELKPFPGRGQAVIRIVTATVATMILSETLRVPEPAFSAYLVFFIANEDGVSSAKFGLAAMTGVTLALALAIGINLCFMDAPWFRLPVTLCFIAVAIWLARVLVLAPVGRLLAVVLVLCLSLADTIFDPQDLTEATLYLWPIVGLAIGTSVLTSFFLEPRPDLLFRAQLAGCLQTVRLSLQARVEGKVHETAQARALRRLLYNSPPHLRLLLGRWRQRKWPERYDAVDWDLAILIVERLLAAAALLAAAPQSMAGGATLSQIARALDQLETAVRERKPHLLETLVLPPAREVPDGADAAAVTQMIAALGDCRAVLTPRAATEAQVLPPSEGAAKGHIFIPDALTNPDYLRFAAKTVLAIIACEVFLNAVAWPGIRTCMITCAVTALSTAGAARQKQLLRLTGVFAGGLMGLASVLWLVPKMDTIASLSLLVAAGTAICAWVAAGGVRSSYGGFQMALAFYLVILPGFQTSVDLTAIRDRFVGVLVGITAMWMIFDHLWHTSSKRQLIQKLIAILQRMARTVKLISPAESPTRARRLATSSRDDLIHELAAARESLDETRIELTLAIRPTTVRKDQLEEMANELTFAALELLALNDRKVELLAAGEWASLAPRTEPQDAALEQNFSELAKRVGGNMQTSAQPGDSPELGVLLAGDSPGAGFDSHLQSLYQTLGASVQKISGLAWMARALS